ncbi:MAG: DUF1622 domain-containing protein [Halopseudomonas sp.]
MADWVIQAAEWTVLVTEVLGLGIIALAALYSIGVAGVHAIQRYNAGRIFREVRQRLGHGILLGLEFLIAADIIRTVAIDLTFESIGVLALIVLVRTFLSFTLEVELTGNWPWQRGDQAESEAD